jgi:hypothetical protein
VVAPSRWHYRGKCRTNDCSLIHLHFRALDSLSNSEGTAEGAKTDEFFKGVEKYPYKAVSRALEIIPRTLIQNCGGNVVKQLTTLRAKHHQQADQFAWGGHASIRHLGTDCRENANHQDSNRSKLTMIFHTQSSTSVCVCSFRRPSYCCVLMILSRARRKLVY